MIRTFIKNSSIYLVSNGITKVIGLAFFAYIARVLTVEQMGQFGMLNVLLTLLVVVMTLQIHAGYTRYYLDLTEAERPTFEFSTVNALVLWNVGMGAALFLLRPVLEALVVPMGPVLCGLVLSLPLASAMTALFGSKLRLQNRALTAGVLNVAQLLVYVGGTVLLLRLGVAPLSAIFGGMLLQNAFVIVWYVSDMGRWDFAISFASLRRSVIFSALIVPAALGAYLSILTGKYIVGWRLGIESVGIYEASSKVAMIIQTIMQPLLQATSPIVYGQYRQPDFPPRYYLLLHIHMVAVLGLVVAFSLFSREAVHVVVGSQYLAHAHLVFPFVMAAVLMHMTDFYVSQVHLSGKTQYITLVELVTGTVSAGVTYVLIWGGGFRGAIVALLVSYGLRCLMYAGFANGLVPKLRISRWQTASYLGLCSLILLGHFYLRELPLAARLVLALGESTLLLAAFLWRYRVHPRQLLSLVRPG